MRGQRKRKEKRKREENFLTKRGRKGKLNL